MLVAGNFAWVPHVKLPVKCLWYSGKFTCACWQFACILREVLAASTQVNLPVFTGKLHVTQVNCVWGLFTCELQVKLPAFAGNFAGASFTVYVQSERGILTENIFTNLLQIFWRSYALLYMLQIISCSNSLHQQWNTFRRRQRNDRHWI